MKKQNMTNIYAQMNHAMISSRDMTVVSTDLSIC